MEKFLKTKIVKPQPLLITKPVLHQRIPRLLTLPPEVQIKAILRPRVADQVVGRNTTHDRKNAFTWALFTHRPAK